MSKEVAKQFEMHQRGATTERRCQRCGPLHPQIVEVEVQFCQSQSQQQNSNETQIVCEIYPSEGPTVCGAGGAGGGVESERERRGGGGGREAGREGD